MKTESEKKWKSNIPVMKGGLFEQYEGNTPLEVVSNKHPDIDLSWFKTINKKEVIIADSKILAPSFYYKNSSITGFYTAPLDVLKKIIPAKILEVSSLLSHDQDNGIVAITGYDYEICDVDHYNEMSIAVLLTKPNTVSKSTSEPAKFVSETWAHVLKLPVDSELARVGGVELFNLPKWNTRIDHNTNDHHDSYDIYDESGKIDFSITGDRLDISSKTDEVVRINFINVDKNGKLTVALSDTRALQIATKEDNKGFVMKFTDGALSEYVKELKLGELIAYEYKPSFQNALYVPEFLEAN